MLAHSARFSAQVIVGLALWSGPLMAEQPLSAINWLSESVTAAPGSVVDGTDSVVFQPGDSERRVPEDVTVSVIGAVSLDALGILSSNTTGLPRNLWGFGLTEEIAATVTAERAGTLPALRSLLMTILLAEADAPADSDGKGQLLLARIDKLLDMGALDQAASLLAVAGDSTTDLFRRSFDVSLLLGTEDATCKKMQSLPELAPTPPARIFCLARAGEWNLAAIALGTAREAEAVSDEESMLLARFLEPELGDDADPLPSPEKPSPLILRMYEAIGEPLSLQGLPVAFSHADLNSRTGWKAQIEAAERLARNGAIPANRLFGLYTERQAAASGGVWDRVAAVQDFDEAAQNRDSAAIASALPAVWKLMTEAELEVPFASFYASALQRQSLPVEADQLAFRVMLLSENYEKAALARKSASPEEAFLVAIARGNLENITPPDALARAIAPAFLDPQPSEDARELIAQGRVGETMLLAIDLVQSGATGDLSDVTEGLTILRILGLEDTARRAALELILLERRG